MGALVALAVVALVGRDATHGQAKALAAKPSELQAAGAASPLVAAQAQRPALLVREPHKIGEATATHMANTSAQTKASHRSSTKRSRETEPAQAQRATGATEVIAPQTSTTPSVPPQAAEAPKTGRLIFDSTPYSVVSLDGKRLGITPIDVELPATKHTLALRNPERGIETTYLVTVPAGRSIRRKVAID